MTIILPGRSFPSAFVFSINSLILPGFPFTSFHLTEASLSAFLWLCALVCAVAQKILRNVFNNYSHFQHSFCNQPTLFAQLKNVNKLQNNNRTVHVNKIITKENQVSQIQIGHAFYCPIQPTNNAMVSLKDDFTVIRQGEKEDFLSMIYFLAQHDVLSWRKSNFLQ